MKYRRKEAKAELDQAISKLYETALALAPDGKRNEIIEMRDDIEWCVGMLSIAILADCEEMQFPAKGGAR